MKTINKILIAILINIISNYIAFAYDNCGFYNSSGQITGGGVTYNYVVQLYETQQEASDAADASQAGSSYPLGIYFSGASCPYDPLYFYDTCCYGGYHSYTRAAPAPAIVTINAMIFVVNVCDGDMDGVPDNQDMYPEIETPENCKYRIAYEVYDDEETMRAYMIETNYGDSAYYGDLDWLQGYFDGENEGHSKMYLNVGNAEYPYDCTSVGDTDNEVRDGLVISETQNTYYEDDVNSNGESQVEASGIVSGSTTSGSETDNQLLEKIVNNTAGGLENDQTIADRLLAIEKYTREILAKNSTSGLGSSINNPDLSEAIGEEIREIAQDEIDDAAQEISDLEDYIPEDELAESGFTENDAPEKNAIGNILDYWVENNPMASIISESGAEVGEQDSSIDIDLEVMGKQGNIEFEFATYEDWLSLMGSLILAFSTLAGIVSILRG